MPRKNAILADILGCGHDKLQLGHAYLERSKDGSVGIHLSGFCQACGHKVDIFGQVSEVYDLIPQARKEDDPDDEYFGSDDQER